MSVSMCYRLALVLALVTSWAASASAQLAEFYIGVDGRTTPLNAPSGVGGGAYPDNPNRGRLTFLYNHGDHYHGIGTYNYSGPAVTPTLNDTNANNRIPETYTNAPPLELLPGSGVYAGKKVSMHVAGVDYSNLEMRSVHSLANSGDLAIETLYRSSSNRWDGLFDDADIHLKLLGVSSPHLNVGSIADPNALAVGGDVHLGEGNELFSFTPVLWVDQAAPVGSYSAEFQLLDLSGTFGNSGRFFIDVQQVPEPSTLLLGGVFLVGATACQRRRC